MDDAKILELFISRDESALEETRRRYGARLFRTALNILGSREDAEEIVSDTMFKAWENVHISKPNALGAFLAKISRNMALNKWKARQTVKRGGGETTLLLGELEDTIPGGLVPERAFEEARTSAAINACIAKLDSEARACFVLRYFHGESIADICTRLRMSQSKCKSMLLRTRKKLHDHLQKEEIL